MRFKPYLTGQKVNQNQYSDLQRELRKRGYSDRYIHRLINELTDHWTCVESESDPHGTQSEFTKGQRIGNSSQILEVLDDISVLEPWPRRKPVVMFAFFPAMVLLAFNLLAVVLGNSLTNTRPFDSIFLNGVIATTIAWSSFMFPIGVTIATSWLAVRYRASWDLPLVSALIMGISSFLLIKVVHCAESGYVICTQSWTFDPIQLICIVAPAALCIVASRWFNSLDEQPQFSTEFNE